ncbi:MAG: hypothetical protein QXV83_01785 [Candidatus Anstonellaceae archaeon]
MNKIIIQKILLFVFLIANLNLAADIGFPNIGEENFFNSAFYRQFSDLSVLLVAIIIFVISIGYMAINLFKLPLVEQLKAEVRQIIISVLIGLLIFGFAIVVDNIISVQFGNKSVFVLATEYLKRVISLSLEVNIKLDYIRAFLQYISNLKGRYWAYPYGWGVAIPLFPGMEIIEKSIGVINFLLTPFTSSLIVQAIGLEIIRATAITLLLPAGIIIRIIPTLRDSGSFLIATAFGLYFILPYLYVIEATVIIEMYKKEFGSEMGSAIKLYNSYNLDTTDLISKNYFPDLMKDFASFFVHISYIILQSLVLPAINMVLVVSGIQSFTKFISMRLD